MTMCGFDGFDLGCSENDDGTVTICIVGHSTQKGIDGYVANLTVTKDRASQLAGLISDVASGRMGEQE